MLHASDFRGVVRDQSGAAVANAQVELRSRHLDLVTHSNASGEFLLQRNPPAGTLTVRAEGFATAVLPCCSSDPIMGDLATTLALSGGTDRNIGAFAELSVSPFRRMRASLGARLDQWSTDNSFSRTLALSGAPPVINPLENHSESAISPRLGVVYEMPASFEAIASVYDGFRAPTLNELYRSFRLGNVVTQANAQLRAERLHGGEAGFRYVRTRYMITAVFFRERVDDPVANVTQSVTPALVLRQRENAGALTSDRNRYKWCAGAKARPAPHRI